jgi:hypothetical protein
VTDQRPPEGFPGPRHASGEATPALSALVPRAGAHRARRHRRLRTNLLRAIPALAVVALVTVFVLRPSTPEDPPGTGAPGRHDPAAADLVPWVDAELRPDTPVLVPDDLLDDVTAAGGAEERFRPLDADAPGVLLVEPGEPPPGSVVLTRFEGADGTALTLVDPHPGQPTPHELERRQRLSAAVLANPHTGATGRAADVLRRAHVDARLLDLLAVLVTQLRVGIADFPPAPGEPADGPPARSVLLDRVDGEALAPGAPATERLLAFVDAQLPPFAPDAVEVTARGILVRFRYESAPDAVVTEKAP